MSKKHVYARHKQQNDRPHPSTTSHPAALPLLSLPPSTHRLPLLPPLLSLPRTTVAFNSSILVVTWDWSRTSGSDQRHAPGQRLGQWTWVSGGRPDPACRRPTIERLVHAPGNAMGLDGRGVVNPTQLTSGLQLSAWPMRPTYDPGMPAIPTPSNFARVYLTGASRELVGLRLRLTPVCRW